MSKLRPAAVAGMFYDADPGVLRHDIVGYLDRAVPAQPGSLPPKAIIVPHAGYVYSGPVAASAYAAAVGLRDHVKRIVLLGPAHRVYIKGVAVPTADAFETPLGSVPVDQATLRRLAAKRDFIHFSDPVHAAEHSLEVQLPFLQEIFPAFTLLPFAVGDAAAEDVETLIGELWGGDETLIVISSDLSHFRAYDAAREIDRFTSGQIEKLAPGALTGEHACGYLPISGLLRVAARKELHCEILDLRNSGDTAGPRDRVVGYGAYAFYPA